MTGPDGDEAGVATVTACPTCAEPVEATDAFCEACGTELDTGAAAPETVPQPSPTCAVCGGEIAADGYCEECGRAAHDRSTDHWEDELAPDTASVPGPRAAGVSDRGHRRRRNEDSFALGRAVARDGTSATVVVVADGVASVPDGDRASRAACDAAVAAGCEALADGEDLDAAGAYAAAVARHAVAALAPEDGTPPACTYVAAVVADDHAVISWVGDSRAYWLAPGDGSSSQLTDDDSLAAEGVAAGLVDPETAYSHPSAHVITRWLAADAPDQPAHSVRRRLDTGGALLLCSDGVWNHLPDPDVLAAVLDPVRWSDDVPSGARALVQAALDDGGTDNATAVLLTLAPTGTPPSGAPPSGNTGPTDAEVPQ